MKRNFTNENFEAFLRQNADGLRMRPSDKVWGGISNQLNKRRRRFALVLSATLLLTAGTGYYLSQQNSSAVASNNHANTGAKKTIYGTNPSKTTTTYAAYGDPVTQRTASVPVRKKTFHLPSVLTSGSVFTSLTTAAQPEAIETPFTPGVVDAYLGDAEGKTSASQTTVEKKKATDPQTIESVVNSYKPGKRLGFQFYFTPTVSYRKLNDNNIDNVVIHKPDFGFELGMTSRYALTDHLRVRAGVQFNVNRYSIKTFDSSPQTATIRLNGAGYVSTATNYNNFSGYKSNWIENFFFQVSAPVGLELKLKGDDHTSFGIASTLQPTYILGDRAYVISSDYKNYAEVPGLIRRWNLNTSFETFVAYSTGRLQWQVGPQVRYQLLSTYVKKYPVKENLFDFGLKVGISLHNH